METPKCIVCKGSGRLRGYGTCPLCDGDATFCTDTGNCPQFEKVWEVSLGGSWAAFHVDTEAIIVETLAAGRSKFEYSARGQRYIVDLANMEQMNSRTRVKRAIRCVEVEVHSSDDEELDELVLPSRSEREVRLVDHLLSPAVQVPLPAEVVEVPNLLSSDDIQSLFIARVPGVKSFLYREMPGQFALEFIIVAYSSGLRAFHGTPLHNHLLWLLRVIVHYGHEDGCGAAAYLRELAEAFMDCQAVQARIIERLGLEIRGVRTDFKGLVTRLAGEYKAMAIKMLAHDRIARRLAVDDGNPTHYENRLTADLGDALGLNKDDIRLARLDKHAEQRFPRFRDPEFRHVAANCRDMFDLEAFVKALGAEVNSLSEHSPDDSLPRLFVNWASSRMVPNHVIFDEETCTRVELREPLPQAVIEDVILGQVAAQTEDEYRGQNIRSYFISSR